MEASMEQWAPIMNWDGYEVSNLGRVRSHKFCRQMPRQILPRLISPWVLDGRYQCVTFKERGRKVNMYVHRIVATAFLGPAPEGTEVAHNNGDGLDNRLDNLRYATPQENAADKAAHGTHMQGERCPASRIAENVARGLKDYEGTHTEAAKAFGVTYHNAYVIRTGRSWKHLS